MGNFQSLIGARVFAKGCTIVLLAFLLVLGFALSSLPMRGMANEAPAIKITHPPDGAEVSGIILINGVAWDDVEVVGVDILFDQEIEVQANITHQEGQHSFWEYSWDTTEFSDGWHLVQARAWDGELLSPFYSIEVYVQNEPTVENHKPFVTIEYPDPGQVVSGVVIIYGHAWDLDEGDYVEMVQVAFDNIEHWYNATDTSGNGTWWTWAYEWDTTAVENGEHKIIARSWDGELFSDPVDEWVVVHNEVNEPPECWIEYPENGDTVSGIVEVIVAARDDREVITVQISIDEGPWEEATFSHMVGNVSVWIYEWNTTVVEDGWHIVLARAYDGELFSQIYDIHVLVDNLVENHKPWVSIEQPGDGDVVSGVIAIRGHAGDPDKGDYIQIVQIAVDHTEDWFDCIDTSGNGTWWSWACEWDTRSVENGWHYIVARSWDGELYSDLWDVHIIVQNEVENQRSIVEIVHPLENETVSGTVLVHGEASDPDREDRIEVVLARIDQEDWFHVTDTSHDDSWSTWAFQWDTARYENGEHCVYAKAYSGGLWSEVDSVCILVQNENHRPKVSITHPEWEDTLKGLYLIHGTASDPDERDRVEIVLLRLDQGEWRHATDTSPDGSFYTWAYEWNTEEVEDGVHEICAKSYDGELFSEVVCVEILTDNMNDPPRVEIIHPSMGDEVSGIVLIHGTARDDRDVEGVVVRIDHGEWEEATDVSRDQSWRTWALEWVTTDYENGEHIICAKAWDGELWSKMDCVEVIVNNEQSGQGINPGGSALGEDWTLPPLLLLIACLSAVCAVVVGSHLFGVRKP